MKKFVFGGLFLCAISAFGSSVVEVYKSPTCGCCTKWSEHMRANGFEVNEHFVKDTVVLKKDHNVPLEYSSCHTGIINGYVVEGHVPANEVRRLIDLKPEGVVGISVPGMPLHSPGMEQGNMPEQYDVILFKADGSYSVFATYIGAKRIR